MSKYKSILALMLFSFTLIGCSESKQVNAVPEQSQMEAICELATMDCYFNNVAKYTEEDATGMLFWKKDKNFWIEYSGIVTLGIDSSLVELSVDNDKVTIEIPKAKVLGSKVDNETLSEDSYIFDDDSATIEADDQTLAFEIAQQQMEDAAANDEYLLSSAQQRAQTLLEDYVNNIGSAIGVDYKIEWIYLDESSNNESDSDTN